MEQKIITLHPEGKEGVRIDEQKYTAVKEAILACLSSETEVGFTELVDMLDRMLKPAFEGSIPWYATTVKLDLEARGLIERVPGKRPQHLRLLSRSR